MVSTLEWVLLGFVIYTVAVFYANRHGLLPSFIGTQGPILTLRTKRGRAFLNWLAGPKRFWRAWANVGVGIALVVMLGSFLYLVLVAFLTLRDPPTATAVSNPKNFLVIPGVNDFLPLSAAPSIVFGLAVGLIVHEGGHGLLSRVEDIEIEAMGLALLAILPIGAFVEPNEEQRREKDRGAQTRMFAAGVTNNFAITILAYALLFGPLIASLSVAPGAAVGDVLAGSPADDADIGVGDRITAVNGTTVEANDDLRTVLDRTSGTTVPVTLNGDTEATVKREVLVVKALTETPSGISRNHTIREVNGTPVSTSSEFYSVLNDSSTTVPVRYEENGTNETTPFTAGAYALVIGDGPFDGAGAPAGENVIITHVDGERVLDMDSLLTRLDERPPGSEVSVRFHHENSSETVNVTLGEREGSSYLGIRPYEGTSGIVVDDFGVKMYPTEQLLDALDDEAAAGGATGLVERFFGAMIGTLFLPFAGVIPLAPLSTNFAGFQGPLTNFFVAEGGPLSGLGADGLFVLANLAFWTGWINVQLGFFNCIPAFPLDGGHILRTGTEAVLSRLPIEPKRRHVRYVTTTVGLTMLASLAAVVIVPSL